MFAGARIPPALEAQLGSGYVTLGDIADPAGDTTRHSFATIGYPNSKNDDYDHETKKVRTHVFPYSNTARSDDKLRRKVGQNGVHHIFLGYSRHSKGPDGRKVSSINPKGLSGGALVDADPLGDLRVFTAEIE